MVEENRIFYGEDEGKEKKRKQQITERLFGSLLYKIYKQECFDLENISHTKVADYVVVVKWAS